MSQDIQQLIVVENIESDMVIAYYPYCSLCTTMMKAVGGAAIAPDPDMITFGNDGFIAGLEFACPNHPAHRVKASNAQLELINKYPTQKQFLRALNLQKFNKKLKKQIADKPLVK